MTAPDRFHALDAARAAALLLGIVLHATMSFFLVLPAQDVSQSTTLGVTFYVIHMFRMSLFYFIAGFFARLVFHRRGARAFIKDRAKRILVPMTAGWIVLAPPTIAAVIWGLTRTFPNGPPPGTEANGGLPQGFPLTHLWFLYYLSLFYLLALALRAALVTLVDRSGALRALTDKVVGTGVASYLAPLVLAAPIFAVLYTTADWPVWFGVPTPDTGFTPKIPALAGFGTAFAFGWIVHRQAAVLGVLEKQWLVNLALAVGLTTGCLAIIGLAPSLDAPTVVEGGARMRAVYAACYTAAIWYWSFGLIGAAMRFCSQPSGLRRYLADSSYWLYLGHLPIVFFLQALLMKVPLHWAIKFPLIVAITLAVLLVSYHYLVRPTSIGALLNGRKYPRGPLSPQSPGSGTATASVGALAVFSVVVLTAAHPARTEAQQQDPFGGLYKESCSVCHGEQLEGAAQGTPLVGELRHGDSIAELTKSIADGFAATGMPAWSATLDETQIQRLAIFIAEQRSKLAYTDFKIAAAPAIPEGVIKTERHAFRIETVVTGLDPLPYSIAPLPDGRLLLTEKTRGLSIISQAGEQSALVRGTPQAFDDGFEVPGILLVYGQGYLLDIAPHPDYEQNGWIYLHYTDRCSDCNTASRTTRRPASMNKVIRGRLEDGAWVDQQTIWQADIENYTAMPDMGAGGRLAFDEAGHVFLSVGIKGGSEFAGIQDLSVPFGKIHRINDDGSVPTDNPFVGTANALPTIWTYGHRSPQGLEFDPVTRQLWGTEMGQRGGDEVNLLVRGRNYGWPLVSKGLKYDGTPVDYGKEIGIAFDPKDIEQPVVDLTPSPAVSSFIVYDGSAFPNWRQNLLVGTLKATELYRMVVEGDRVVQRETLLTGLGRIRDIEAGADGRVYLLLEHASGSRILRLVPEE